MHSCSHQRLTWSTHSLDSTQQGWTWTVYDSSNAMHAATGPLAGGTQQHDGACAHIHADIAKLAASLCQRNQTEMVLNSCPETPHMVVACNQELMPSLDFYSLHGIKQDGRQDLYHLLQQGPEITSISLVTWYAYVSFPAEPCWPTLVGSGRQFQSFPSWGWGHLQ